MQQEEDNFSWIKVVKFIILNINTSAYALPYNNKHFSRFMILQCKWIIISTVLQIHRSVNVRAPSSDEQIVLLSGLVEDGETRNNRIMVMCKYRSLIDSPSFQ